jgi:hypothetical protein
MKSETAEEIDLGLQVADGEQLKLSYESDSLACSFLDWREQKTEFRCLGVLSFRWQPLEYHLPDERPDCTYEILNSRWIAAHHEQGQIGSRQAVRHFRLNFNAIGCLEVICREIKKK